jgi:cytochrome c nitrite reductase small subunit
MNMSLWSTLSLQGATQKVKTFCLISTGAFFGLSIYVFNLSNAGSYLSDDPEACMNCHIMTPQYASWKHSSHARVASCNDCHVPHDSDLRKYYFKAKDGSRHATLFTLRKEPQVIRATEESREVVEENCRRCHQDQIDQITLVDHSGAERACADCHREVPHGRVNSLSSTPNAAVPLPDTAYSRAMSKFDSK